MSYPRRSLIFATFMHAAISIGVWQTDFRRCHCVTCTCSTESTQRIAQWCRKCNFNASIDINKFYNIAEKGFSHHIPSNKQKEGEKELFTPANTTLMSNAAFDVSHYKSATMWQSFTKTHANWHLWAAILAGILSHFTWHLNEHLEIRLWRNKARNKRSNCI